MAFRMKRDAYWIAMVPLVLLTWGMMAFALETIFFFPVLAVSTIAMVVMTAARCRDVGENPWLSLWVLLPFVGTSVALLMAVQPSVRRMGDPFPSVDARVAR